LKEIIEGRRMSAGGEKKYNRKKGKCYLYQKYFKIIYI
jgi:hypothetical protein